MITPRSTTVHAMHPATAAFWGFLGALVVEAYDNLDEIRRSGQPLWKRRVGRKQIGFGIWIFSVALRVGSGAIVAAVAVAGGAVTGPLATFAIGVGGPLALEGLMRRVPLSIAPDRSVAEATNNQVRQDDRAQGTRRLVPAQARRATRNVGGVRATARQSATEGATGEG